VASAVATLRSAELASTSTTRSAAADAPHRNAQLATSPTLRPALASALSHQVQVRAKATSSGALNLALANAFQIQTLALKVNSGISPNAHALASQRIAQASTTLGTSPLASANAAHPPFALPTNSSTLSHANARRTQRTAWPATTGMLLLTAPALASASHQNVPHSISS